MNNTGIGGESQNQISIRDYRVQTQTASEQVQQDEIVNTEGADMVASNSIKIEKTEILNTPTTTTFLTYNATKK